MSLQELINHPMPIYSKKEEIFNTISHFVGIIIGVCIMCISIYVGINNNVNSIPLFALLFFSFSIILLYSMSTIYHGLRKDSLSKKVMRIVDHCTIYFFIAGTYTPICIISLSKSFYGYIILILQWFFAIIGIIINAIALNKKTIEIITMILYLITGWMLVFFPKAIMLLPSVSFFFILSGGIVYTIGSILYGIGAKKKWFHSVFHVFCLVGTICQAIGIFLLI